MDLVNGGGQTVDYDPTLGGGATRLRVRRRRANVYTLTSSKLGAESGSFVARPDGGFTLTIGDLSGTGDAMLVGSTVTIR